MSLEVGSVVVFVLGSPEMLVYSMTNNKVKCKWFCSNGRLQQSSFKRAELIATGQRFSVGDQVKTWLN